VNDTENGKKSFGAQEEPFVRSFLSFQLLWFVWKEGERCVCWLLITNVKW